MSIASTEAIGDGDNAVTVQDVSIAVPGQPAVTAYLVRRASPAAPRTQAGVLYLHWLSPTSSNQNRTEFRAEAIALAQQGTVALLPNLTFPWMGTFYGDQRDVKSVQDQLTAITTVYQILLAQPDVDPARTAVVGHDYGAMYGAVLTNRVPGVRAEVFMAGDATWSDWFANHFVKVPDRDAYDKLFSGLDPVDNVGRLGKAIYFQWAGVDQYVNTSVRDAFAKSDPDAKTSLYPDDNHRLGQAAQHDRTTWLKAQLGL